MEEWCVIYHSVMVTIGASNSGLSVSLGSRASFQVSLVWRVCFISLKQTFVVSSYQGFGVTVKELS